MDCCLRESCVQHLRDFTDLSTEYLDNMLLNGTWGDLNTLQAAATLHQVKVCPWRGRFREAAPAVASAKIALQIWGDRVLCRNPVLGCSTTPKIATTPVHVLAL